MTIGKFDIDWIFGDTNEIWLNLGAIIVLWCCFFKKTLLTLRDSYTNIYYVLNYIMNGVFL